MKAQGKGVQSQNPGVRNSTLKPPPGRTSPIGHAAVRKGLLGSLAVPGYRAPTPNVAKQSLSLKPPSKPPAKEQAQSKPNAAVEDPQWEENSWDAAADSTEKWEEAGEDAWNDDDATEDQWGESEKSNWNSSSSSWDGKRWGNYSNSWGNKSAKDEDDEMAGEQEAEEDTWNDDEAAEDQWGEESNWNSSSSSGNSKRWGSNSDDWVAGSADDQGDEVNAEGEKLPKQMKVKAKVKAKPPEGPSPPRHPPPPSVKQNYTNSSSSTAGKYNSSSNENNWDQSEDQDWRTWDAKWKDEETQDGENKSNDQGWDSQSWEKNDWSSGSSWNGGKADDWKGSPGETWKGSNSWDEDAKWDDSEKAEPDPKRRKQDGSTGSNGDSSQTTNVRLLSTALEKAQALKRNALEKAQKVPSQSQAATTPGKGSGKMPVKGNGNGIATAQSQAKDSIAQTAPVQGQSQTLSQALQNKGVGKTTSQATFGQTNIQGKGSGAKVPSPGAPGSLLQALQTAKTNAASFQGKANAQTAAGQATASMGKGSGQTPATTGQVKGNAQIVGGQGKTGQGKGLTGQTQATTSQVKGNAQTATGQGMASQGKGQNQATNLGKPFAVSGKAQPKGGAQAGLTAQTQTAQGTVQSTLVERDATGQLTVDTAKRIRQFLLSTDTPGKAEFLTVSSKFPGVNGDQLKKYFDVLTPLIKGNGKTWVSISINKAQQTGMLSGSTPSAPASAPAQKHQGSPNSGSQSSGTNIQNLQPEKMGGAHPMGKPLGTSAGIPSGVKEQRDGVASWLCTQCKTANQVANKHCLMCGAARLVKTLEELAKTASVTRPAGNMNAAPTVAKTAPTVAKTAPMVAKTAPMVAKTAPVPQLAPTVAKAASNIQPRLQANPKGRAAWTLNAPQAPQTTSPDTRFPKAGTQVKHEETKGDEERDEEPNDPMKKWLLGLDGGRGALMQYYDRLREEFDGDLQQVSAARSTEKRPGSLGSVDPAFFEAIGVTKQGHKLLFARGIESLP